MTVCQIGKNRDWDHCFHNWLDDSLSKDSFSQIGKNGGRDPCFYQFGLDDSFSQQF
jgi:hypothetical protein